MVGAKGSALNSKVRNFLRLNGIISSQFQKRMVSDLHGHLGRVKPIRPACVRVQIMIGPMGEIIRGQTQMLRFHPGYTGRLPTLIASGSREKDRIGISQIEAGELLGLQTDIGCGIRPAGIFHAVPDYHGNCKPTIRWLSTRFAPDSQSSDEIIV